MADAQSAVKPANPFRFKASKTQLKEGVLREGQTISVAPPGSDLRLIAVIEKISEKQLSLEFARPIPEVSVKIGDQLRLKLWDYNEAIYCDSVVNEVSGLQGEKALVSRPIEGEIIQRQRVEAVFEEILVSLSVTAAEQQELVGRKAEGLKALNLAQTGFEFQTEIPIQSHDRLEVKLHLPPNRELTAAAEAVTSQQVEEDGSNQVHSVHLRFVDMEACCYNRLALFLAQTLPVGTVDDIFWTG